MKTLLGWTLLALFTTVLVLTYPIVFNKNPQDTDDDDL